MISWLSFMVKVSLVIPQYIDGSTSLDKAVSRSKMIHDPEDRLMQSTPL